MDVSINRVKFHVASWSLSNPLFRGITVGLTMSNWKEVAFSSVGQNPSRPCWFPPLVGGCKLNFDASVIGNQSFAGIGGIIRDWNTSHVHSFSGPVGRHTVNKAELLALNIKDGSPGGSLHGSQGDPSRRRLSMSIDGPLVHANPWDLADEAEEVLELARRLNISFTHIKQSTKPS